jgi:hypothetical protein
VRAVLRSWWVLLALLPFGWLSWLAFLYAGLRARRPLWLAFAAIYFGGGLASFILVGVDGDPDGGWPGTVGTILGLAVWGGVFVHALAIRRGYLDRMDARENPDLYRAQRELEAREAALRLAKRDPRHARDLGIGRPDLNGSFHGGVVDLNNASAEAIAGLPGIDEELARRAVAIREEVGGFDSVLDFAQLLDVPPHRVERLRDRAVALPR